MPKRKAINDLPEKIRRELDERLVSNGFRDFVALSEWLAEEGLSISKSSIGRHSSELKGQHDEAMASARELLALTRASGELGESGAELSRHGSVILQTEILKTSLEIRRETDPEKRASLLAKLTRAQADIGRMVITAEKWKTELNEKLELSKLAAANAAEAIAIKAGMNDDDWALIRAKFLGIEVS